VGAGGIGAGAIHRDGHCRSHTDELRVDLDPGPGVGWEDVRVVALEVKAFLEENGLVGWPKTSGSRGIHIHVRIEPRWTFTEVRRAALALSASSAGTTRSTLIFL
jgi:DNA primase